MPSESSYVPARSGPHARDWLTGGGELGQLIRDYDWSRTPLGPIESWPQSLPSAVSILLPSKAQIAMFWGPNLITLYNDAYRPVVGQKHPQARLAQEFQPDLALLDLGMPKLDGYEAARSIRRQPWGQRMMLVALTGWGPGGRQAAQPRSRLRRPPRQTRRLRRHREAFSNK